MNTNGDVVVCRAIIDTGIDEHQIWQILEGVLQNPLDLSYMEPSNCFDALPHALVYGFTPLLRQLEDKILALSFMAVPVTGAFVDPVLVPTILTFQPSFRSWSRRGLRYLC